MEWRLFLVLAAWLDSSRGHGSLNEPPSRASAWRHGFHTKPDYDDYSAYCGGFAVQWDKNGGKCGVCGDAWHLPEPRPHELGGRYGSGLIVRTYEVGDVIPVTVNLTTFHRGSWLLKLCTDANENNQECFDKIVLQQSNEEVELYPNISRVYELEYKLPDGVTCEHCVVQWAYTAGNNWGHCDDGTSGLGCGPQENFRACADVRIQASSKYQIYFNKDANKWVKTKLKIADQEIMTHPASVSNHLDVDNSVDRQKHMKLKDSTRPRSVSVDGALNDSKIIDNLGIVTIQHATADDDESSSSALKFIHRNGDLNNNGQDSATPLANLLEKIKTADAPNQLVPDLHHGDLPDSNRDELQALGNEMLQNEGSSNVKLDAK